MEVSRCSPCSPFGPLEDAPEVDLTRPPYGTVPLTPEEQSQTASPSGEHHRVKRHRAFRQIQPSVAPPLRERHRVRPHQAFHQVQLLVGGEEQWKQLPELQGITNVTNVAAIKDLMTAPVMRGPDRLLAINNDGDVHVLAPGQPSDCQSWTHYFLNDKSTLEKVVFITLSGHVNEDVRSLAKQLILQATSTKQ